MWLRWLVLNHTNEPTHRDKIVRVLLTVIAYIGSLAIIAVIAFFVVIFLAGPHSGLLPSWLEGAVLVLGWLAVLIMPVLVARRVWRRFGNVEPSNCKAAHQ